MAQQANLTLELDKVKDQLLCQEGAGVAQLLNAVLHWASSCCNNVLASEEAFWVLKTFCISFS